VLGPDVPDLVREGDGGVGVVDIVPDPDVVVRVVGEAVGRPARRAFDSEAAGGGELAERGPDAVGSSAFQLGRVERVEWWTFGLSDVLS